MVWTYQHKYLCQVGVADLVLATLHGNLCSVAITSEKCVEADTFVDCGLTKDNVPCLPIVWWSSPDANAAARS